MHDMYIPTIPRLIFVLFVIEIGHLYECMKDYGSSHSCTMPQHYSKALSNGAVIVDPVWSRYIDLVYGINTSVHHHHLLKKSSIHFEFYYLNAGIRFLSVTPFLSSQNEGLPSTRFVIDPDNYMEGKASHANQWIEVTRFKVSSLFDDIANEGYASPNWTSTVRRRFRYSNSTKVPYGCWFWTAPGSGIYVNVGNVLVITSNKKEIVQTFDGYLNDQYCIDGDHAVNCYDKYYCMAALSRGYDSIHLVATNILIKCSGACATEELFGTCPKLELRTGYNASRPCHCSDASPVLNCGVRIGSGDMYSADAPPSSSSSIPIIDDAKRAVTCISNDDVQSSPLHYNLTLLFSSSTNKASDRSDSLYEERLQGIKDRVRAASLSLDHTNMMVIEATAINGFQVSVAFINGIRKMHYRVFNVYALVSAKQSLPQPTVSDRYLTPDTLIPVLEAGNSVDDGGGGGVSATMITAKLHDSWSLKVGVILLYMVPSRVIYEEGMDAQMGHAIDVALCLRSAGADLIVAIEGSTSYEDGDGNRVSVVDGLEHLGKHLSKYIDVLLVYNNDDTMRNSTEIICKLHRRRLWRGGFADDALPIVMLSDDDDGKIGMIDVSQRDFTITMETNRLGSITTHYQ